MSPRERFKDDGILIIDGFSLLFRAFYSFPPTLSLADGTPINAVFGFISFVLKAVEELKPKYLCVCFDRKEPTFRSERYTEYKAHRPPPPEEFKVQVPHIHAILEKLHIPVKDFAGYEADDLLGTIARKADEEKIPSFIMTGDQDALQLVSDYTSVVMNKKGVSELFIYTPKEVEEKFELQVSQVIDLKALKGDSSDNIPGVKGVGEKTAISLLKQYKNLEEIYENIDAISSKSVKSKLENDKEMAFLSRDLVTICREVPIDIELSSLVHKPDWTEYLQILTDYEFNNLVKRYSYKAQEQLVEAEDSELKAPDGSYACIETEAMLKQLLPLLKTGFAIDLETNSATATEAEIVGIALCITEKKAYYIPLNQYLQTANPSEESVPLFEELAEPKTYPFASNPFLDILKPILEDPSIPKYTHNGKFEIEVFANYQISLKGIAFDTMLAAFLLYPEQAIGLKKCTAEHLGIAMQEFESIVGKGKDAIPFSEVEISTATAYAAADADFTLRLTKIFKEKINQSFKEIYYNIELPTQEVLAQMEHNGVHIDHAYLRELEKEFRSQMTHFEELIIKEAGTSFNLNSPKQLATVLFDTLNLPVMKKTKTGPSTDSSVLEKLSKEGHEIASHLIQYRMYAKLLSTYVQSLPTLINPYTQAIHTSFNQTVAATGRLSSTKPNLQNIPIRTEEGIKIRKAFISKHENGQILSADYSQIELRVLAHLAEDPNMISAFQNDEDIHQATAALIYHVPYNEVSKEQRYNAKTVNFGITYGQSAFALAEQLGISRTEAKEIIDAYYSKFSKIKDFIEKSIEEARNEGGVSTAYGRFRPIPDILSSNKQRQSFAERIAVNTRVQGTAADIMKLAMITVQNAITGQNLKSELLIQVHDELVLDVPKEEIETIQILVKSKMETAALLSVPLKVDMGLGKNWREAH